MKAIKNKTTTEYHGRMHAAAMTIGDMRKIFAWSEKLYPTAQLLAETGPISAEAVQHAMFRSFTMTGFTLWTR